MKRKFLVKTKQLQSIPGNIFAYWCGNYGIFNNPHLEDYYISGGRNKTHNNELYVRSWWEVSDRTRWQPYENGGQSRKWYGNHFDLVDWSLAARDFYASHGGLYNQAFCGIEGICWNLIGSTNNSFRLKSGAHHYSSGSPTIFQRDDSLNSFYVLGFLNCVVANDLLKMFNPTLNTTVSDVLSLPIIAGGGNTIFKFWQKKTSSYPKKIGTASKRHGGLRGIL